jgi:hypothetical protein
MPAITESKLRAEERVSALVTIISGLLGSGSYTSPRAPDVDASEIATERLLSSANSLLNRIEESL